MHHWNELDGALALAALAPDNKRRRRLLNRLGRKAGISRFAIDSRVHYLGYDLSEFAGPKALRAYTKMVKRSQHIGGIRDKALAKVKYISVQRQKQLGRKLSLAQASRVLGISSWVIRRFVYLEVLNPDIRGRITLREIDRFMRSDDRWLLPAVKIGRG